VRNIVLFIRRYANLLFFLLLQIFSIYFIVTYSRHHKAAFSGSLNKISGGVHKQYDKVQYYFQLQKTNDSLVKANQSLYDALVQKNNSASLPSKVVTDSIKVDSITTYKRFNYLSAKVVSNTITGPSNYLVVTGENVPNFKKGMGVVGINNEVVGVVTAIDGNYAVIMSLLHKDSRLNAKLYKSSGESGTLTWNGQVPNMLNLSNIPKSATVKVGDSVVTNISAIFPKGLLFGQVASVKPETANNNFNIVVRSAANFNNIEFVYAIANADADGIKQALNLVKPTSN
jgi:rod shape-determining protein MreC